MFYSNVYIFIEEVLTEEVELVQPAQLLFVKPITPELKTLPSNEKQLE